MNWYKVKFKLKSWAASSWQADTIFGHLCWGMRYLKGEGALRDFLKRYEAGSVPLLLSNGFPGDFLPRPIIPFAGIDRKLSLKEQKEQFRQLKKMKEVRYLTHEEFIWAINNQDFVALSKPKEMKRVTLKNQLNRLTGTTGEEGNLYNFEEYYSPEVTVYLKIAHDFVSEAQNLFQYIADIGYGRRKSVGYGQVEITSPFELFDGFSVTAEPDGFVTLSNFVPSRNDPVKGNWQTIVKYGKMGEEYSQGGSVFKKPLIMFEAGSTFYHAPCREYYGCFVKNLNPSYPELLQYAFALPVPMKLPPQEKE